MRVAVVTDSTSCVPADQARQWGITVVPTRIRIGDRLEDDVRVPRAELIGALRSGAPVATEPPEPAAFYWAYRTAAESGADAIVSAHISARVSTTLDNARRGAERAGVPVLVFDSRTFGMSLGFAVTGAARVAGAGGDTRRVVQTLERRLGGSSVLVYVETLEFLRRHGRIGAAASLLGSALSLKPLLTVADGQIAPLERVLGSARAVRRLVEIAVARAGQTRVDVAVEHVGVPAEADAVLRDLLDRIPNVRDSIATEASSPVSVHVGPGTLVVTISPA